MTGDWAAALDAFAQHLAVQRRTLEAGDPDSITAFTPPGGLGPLPADLAQTALTVLSQAEALEHSIRRALAATAQEDALVRRFEAVGHATTSTIFVDSTA